MQPRPKTDLVYCLRILEAIGKINVYADGYDDPFVFFESNDQKEFNACLLQLLHIGEQVNRISEETKSAYASIPWQTIKALRNIVAHDYVGIDKLIVFVTITEHIPVFKSDVEHIIQTELKRKNFNQTEYDMSKQSNFYRHIDFTTID
ncbi:HepT-like ribonuclease domain-containing protein [Spirosoma humi]